MNDKLPERTEFAIGYDGPDQDVMVVFVPIKHYADHVDGSALVRGKMEEARGIALLKLQEIRNRKLATGVIRPLNGDQPPLRVA